MKRLLFILVACHLSLITTQAQTLSEKYNAKRPVVMVCDWDKPPYEFLNDNGQPAGSNIDIMRKVAEELGIHIKFVMKEWSIALKTFERGQADIILANARRYSNNSQYVVSNNIVNYNRIRVAMHADSVGMVTLKQLEREGAVFKPGDYSAFYFMDGDTINTSFMEFQTPKVALLGLINGDYKYYVWGEEPLKWKIKELNLEGISLNDVGIPISELHLVGRDRQLVNEIDDQYSRLLQSGEVAAIQNRWFHPERNEQKSTPVLLYAIIAAILLLGLLYFFILLARKHVHSATRHSTELNEMMYQALHMGNFKVMQYDIAKDRITNHYGHILPEEGLTLEAFTHRIHPDQRQEFTQKMKRLIEGRERRFELDKRWNKGTDEQPDWLNLQGHAISELDNDGRPAYIINAVHDVTHEMEEDQAARDLIHKYDCLSNIPLVAMSFYDKDGFLLDLNDNMKKLCGMENNADSRRFWETVCMFDVPLFRNVITPDNRDEVHFCQHMEYPDLGINRYIECHITPLFNADGDIVSYFVIAIDITKNREFVNQMYNLKWEEKQTKEQIGLQEKRLVYLLQNSERYIMRSDIPSKTISLYRSLEHPDITYTFDSILAVLKEEDREPVRQIINDTSTRESRNFIIHRLKKADEQTDSVFNITFNPVFDAQGHIIGHEGITADITTLTRAKELLEEEARRASDSVRQKSGFMASMTHELRTPLNAIVGFTGVLEALGDMPERGEYIRIIRNSSDMLQRLINDIIEASTITDGAIAIEPQSVDFAKAFDDICFTLEQRVQNSDVAFLKDNPYQSFITKLDIGRIQQVLTNFVTNAVKFTKEGHIKMGYRYEQHALYLYCEDTGAGIPKDKQAVVFERFVKLDEFVQGTGMGLAICKSIAERCGGEIGVNSEGEGQGATFWVRIPCEQELTDSVQP